MTLENLRTSCAWLHVVACARGALLGQGWQARKGGCGCWRTRRGMMPCVADVMLFGPFNAGCWPCKGGLHSWPAAYVTMQCRGNAPSAGFNGGRSCDDAATG